MEPNDIIPVYRGSDQIHGLSRSNSSRKLLENNMI